jgi:glycosyltransferase involved in cell wall biosynthesis
MKILITCLSNSWGGMEMYSLQTAARLISSGFEVEILCMPNSRLFLEAEKCGVLIHTFSFTRYISPKKCLELSNYLKYREFDIIHVQASKDLWLVVPALKLASINIPLILTKHVGSSVVKRDILHSWLYKRVDLALAISNVIKHNIIDTTPLTEERVILLHNGIDVDKFNPEKISRLQIREQFHISEDEVLIGMNARFSPGKGHEEFLFAANELAHQYNNLKFILIGGASYGEDEYEQKIKSMSSYLGLDDKVIFTGFRKDVPEILASLDIFVFPSHAEAFGLALVEAMSMKLPTVCSNSDGVLDIAVDNETSFLFQKKNYHDLAIKLSYLITQPSKREVLGTAARKRVLDNFSMDLFTSHLAEIYLNQVY